MGGVLLLKKMMMVVNVELKGAKTENGDEDTKKHIGLVSMAHNVDIHPPCIVFP